MSASDDTVQNNSTTQALLTAASLLPDEDKTSDSVPAGWCLMPLMSRPCCGASWQPGQDASKPGSSSGRIERQLAGRSASSRKSSLWDFTQKLIRKAAPEWISQVFLTESSLKGARTATKKKSRVAASCDELANMMSTPFSDINNGIHFLSRAKMCTFSQCEPDAVITGSASEQDSEYAMQVKASGQVEVLEWVLPVRPRGRYR